VIEAAVTVPEAAVVIVKVDAVTAVIVYVPSAGAVAPAVVTIVTVSPTRYPWTVAPVVIVAVVPVLDHTDVVIFLVSAFAYTRSILVLPVAELSVPEKLEPLMAARIALGSVVVPPPSFSLSNVPRLEVNGREQTPGLTRKVSPVRLPPGMCTFRLSRGGKTPY
jgi:hypothetical protein